MCKKININKGVFTIETPSDFYQVFKRHPIINEEKGYRVLDKNKCLCQCDIEKTLNEMSIEFKITDIGWDINNLHYTQAKLNL
jgi:hypothetical protein